MHIELGYVAGFFVAGALAGVFHQPAIFVAYTLFAASVLLLGK